MPLCRKSGMQELVILSEEKNLFFSLSAIGGFRNFDI
jgi:hypothetical protein